MMLLPDGITEQIAKLFDELVKLIRERIILVNALNRLGVDDVDDLIQRNIDRPEIQEPTDKSLKELIQSKEAILRQLRGQELLTPPDEKARKPN